MRLFALLCVALAASFASADESQWGDLQGRFVFDGEPPHPKAITIKADREVFGDTIPDESLIVNETNRGIANALVFLLPAKDDPAAVHPSYDETKNAKVELALEHGRFEPRILLLRTSQTMLQRNKDAAQHNVRIDFLDNAPM